MTQAELHAYNSRRFCADHAKGLATDPGVEREADLHNAILIEIKRRGWIAFYSRMDKPTTATIGQPDIICMADEGRTFYLELKTAKGKLSTEQLAIKAWAKKLNHEVHTVRSLSDFLIIAGK